MGSLTSAHPQRIACGLAVLGLVAASAQAKPIAYADGTTVMGEYSADTMTEFQAFYAPSYRYSVGVGHMSLDVPVINGTIAPGHSHGGPVTAGQTDPTHDYTYVRLNYLPKRWNLESAQANVYVWGSAGQMRIEPTGDDWFAWSVGGQVDYETRRVYVSLRTDLNDVSAQSHRIDTLQLGIAPYKHDYDTVALWFVIQARQYTGDFFEQDTEVAALLRLFNRRAWVEGGVTRDGKVQAMLMFNF